MRSKLSKSIFERSTGVTLREPETKQNEEEEIMSAQGIGSDFIREVQDLVDAVKEGRLDTRADLKGVSGDERELLQGVNELIDAIVAPLNVTAEYVDRISKGDIPKKITDNYKGDFNEIKNNLNQCIDALNGLINESARLADGASWTCAATPVSSWATTAGSSRG